jgi:pyruvyltransferase
MGTVDFEESVNGVAVVRWNPERDFGLDGGNSRADNFGDLLGPLIVERLSTALDRPATPQSRRLLTAGSIVHFAHSGDVVWGSGVNGKIEPAEIDAETLDIRAVRGPLSQRILQDLGYAVPRVFGDPALLLPHLFPETIEWAQVKRRGLTVIHNVNDLDDSDSSDPDVFSPREPVWDVIHRIAESEFVIGSSLHAVIVAEALGVPSRPCASGSEHRLKYDDYYASTGRHDVQLATDRAEALAIGPVRPGDIDLAPLIAAFPSDLWATVMDGEA